MEAHQVADTSPRTGLLGFKGVNAKEKEYGSITTEDNTSLAKAALGYCFSVNTF